MWSVLKWLDRQLDRLIASMIRERCPYCWMFDDADRCDICRSIDEVDLR